MNSKKLLLTILVILCCFSITSCSLFVVTDVSPDTTDLTEKTDTPVLPQIPDIEQQPTLQKQIYNYLSTRFDKAYLPYYEGLEYEISGYNEAITEDEFSATFYFTMYHLDSGGDIASEIGKQSKANFEFKVVGKCTDGRAEIHSVMMNAAPVGEPDYSVPLEDCFPDENASLTLIGYIKEINVSDRKLTFDKVFWLTSPENDELLFSLGITDDDMPNGFYVYNPSEVDVQYEIAPDADFYRHEILENRPWVLVESELSMIAETLNTKTMLYTVDVENGVITTISEKYMP